MGSKQPRNLLSSSQFIQQEVTTEIKSVVTGMISNTIVGQKFSLEGTLASMAVAEIQRKASFLRYVFIFKFFIKNMA